ncbi:MAG: hypothetical protein QM647_15175 [Asticcacaulis sp.]|uniref:hypothetical protein n=1 Tax=Asticcacaulis sp. TaxID=1872648 RepID=UPI0039E45A2A
MNDNEEILEKFEAMYLVYNARSPLVGDALVKYFSQYSEALRGCTVEMFDRVLRIWQYERESKRFPYPNELNEIVQSLRSRADEPVAEAWHQISRQEYADLTLRAKVRYLTILAFEYRKAAGPMFGPGKGEGPAKPEAFAKWSPLAEQCEAECRRLSQQLSGYDDGKEAVFQEPVMRLVASLPFGRSAEFMEAAQ